MDDLNTLTEKIKRYWDSDSDDDLGDLLHHYFEATDRSDWTAVADEGRVAFELMTGDPLEEDTPFSALISAVAAQAACGVEKAFAAALGLNPKYVTYVIANWVEKLDGEDYPPPISFEEFKRRCEQEEKEWESK